MQLQGTAATVWFAGDKSLADALQARGLGVDAVPLAAFQPRDAADTSRTRWTTGSCPAVWVGPGVSELSIGSLDALVAEAVRIAGGLIGLVVPLEWGRTASDWDESILALNGRIHPARHTPQVEQLTRRLAPEGFAVLLFEKIPALAAQSDSLVALRAGRNLHRDMLRETGRRADAHTRRYALAREWVRPQMQVLDAACGLGYGAAILRTDSTVRITGVDLSRDAVEYAQRHYANVAAGDRFLAGEVTQLAFAKDSTFDLVTSFETIEHVLDSEAYLAELKRVLKPDGRLILSVPNRWLDEEAKKSESSHWHVFEFAQVSGQLRRHFRIEQVDRQNAGGGWKRPQEDGVERVEGIEPDAETCADAEWWIVVAQRESEPVVSASDSIDALPPAQVPGRPPRVALLDEPERHAELFGQALDQLRAERLDARGLSTEALVAANPDVLVLSREWTPEWRLAAAACGRAGIPVVYVMDGVLEWSYVWKNLSHIRPQGTMLQPLLADDLCLLGRHPARILASLGLGPRIHVVGLPRLDRYPRVRRVEAGAPRRVLIATARTAGHDPEQQVMARRALRDLKAFLDSLPTIVPVWRIAADLAEDIGVTPEIAGSFSAALETASALIAFPSTCVLEAMLKGVPVAQIEYRAVPLYVATAWEIRSTDMIPAVIQELLHPPAEKLAWQNACLADELEVGDASGRLAGVLAEAIRRRGGRAGRETPAISPDAALDFRQVHSELSAFAAAPMARLQYELDAAHRLLRETRQHRNRSLGQASELVESAFGREITEMRVFSFVDQLAQAVVRTERHGSVSSGPASLAGRTARTLFLGAPARAAWRMPTGAAGVFAFAISIHPDAWDNPESGACAFQVRINGELVLDVVMDVRVEPEDRKWHWFSLPVPALPSPEAGSHEIVLHADGVGGEAFRWTLWRNPQFVWSDEKSNPQGAWAPVAARLPDYYVTGRTVV